jgi:hypothetical protein
MNERVNTRELLILSKRREKCTQSLKNLAKVVNRRHESSRTLFDITSSGLGKRLFQCKSPAERPWEALRSHLWTLARRTASPSMAQVSMAQVLFFIFLVIFVVALVMGLVRRRPPPI